MIVLHFLVTCNQSCSMIGLGTCMRFCGNFVLEKSFGAGSSKLETRQTEVKVDERSIKFYSQKIEKDFGPKKKSLRV